MHVCKWYLSAGTLQHLYTEIQESKFKEQAEKNDWAFAGH